MVGKNNPFNIRNNRKNKWLGQIGSQRGFCCFSQLDYGIRAACVILANYRKYGLSTIMQIVSRFAPPDENDTKAYVRFVIKQTGIASYDILNSDDQYVRVLVAMSHMEGNSIAPDQVFDVINKFNINFFSVYEKENH